MKTRKEEEEKEVKVKELHLRYTHGDPHLAGGEKGMSR